MDYKIVQVNGVVASLEAKVQDMIKKGYKPIGGVCRISGGSYGFCQAMVKE